MGNSTTDTDIYYIFNPFKPTGRYSNHLLKPPYLLNHNRKRFQQHFVINILGLMNNFQSVNHDFVHCFFSWGLSEGAKIFQK